MTTNSKKCSKCKKEKDISLFSLRSDRKEKKQYRSWCNSCCSKHNRQYIRSNPEKLRAWSYRSVRKSKIDALSHYSTGIIMCACCAEVNIEFLAIDHIEGGGNKHRKTVGAGSGQAFYTWLKKNNYPSGFRVLCHNCNMSYGMYNHCPHQYE